MNSLCGSQYFSRKIQVTQVARIKHNLKSITYVALCLIAYQ